MSKKSDDARAARNRLAQKFDTKIYASSEAAKAAGEAIDQGLVVKFEAGESLYGIVPIGSPKEKGGPARWRAFDVRLAITARKANKARLEKLAREKTAEEPEEAPDEVGAPEEIEAKTEEAPEEAAGPTARERIIGTVRGIGRRIGNIGRRIRNAPTALGNWHAGGTPEDTSDDQLGIHIQAGQVIDLGPALE